MTIIENVRGNLMWFVENYDGFSENVRKCSKNHHFEGKYFFQIYFFKIKIHRIFKIPEFDIFKLGESYDSAIFYEQTDRKIDVFQANVPDVRQGTQELWNPTMLRNLTFNRFGRLEVILGCFFQHSKNESKSYGPVTVMQNVFVWPQGFSTVQHVGFSAVQNVGRLLTAVAFHWKFSKSTQWQSPTQWENLESMCFQWN